MHMSEEKTNLQNTLQLINLVSCHQLNIHIVLHKYIIKQDSMELITLKRKSLLLLKLIVRTIKEFFYKLNKSSHSLNVYKITFQY